MMKNVLNCGERVVKDMFKVGIIGAGKRYKSLYKDVLDALTDRIQIVGFVTKSGRIDETIGEYKVFSSINDMCNYDKPNFLISVVPHHSTPSIIEDACVNKCNILAETPIGNINQSHSMLDNIQKSGIVAGVVEQWPFLPMECFKKKLIDLGLLGTIYLAENDYRTYDYHGVSQLRNYLGKNANFVDIKGKTEKLYSLNGSGDRWKIIIAELDNGKTLLYKYTDLYKRVDVRNFKSIRVYGDKGTIISDCLLDSDTPEMFSIIWEDGKTHHLSINTIYSSDSDLQEINTKLPDGSVIEWKNKFNGYGLNEHQISIAYHIDSMIQGKALWSVEDGFKDLQIL